MACCCGFNSRTLNPFVSCSPPKNPLLSLVAYACINRIVLIVVKLGKLYDNCLFSLDEPLVWFVLVSESRPVEKQGNWGYSFASGRGILLTD